jgi:hypothetical protein
MEAVALIPGGGRGVFRSPCVQGPHAVTAKFGERGVDRSPGYARAGVLGQHGHSLDRGGVIAGARAGMAPLNVAASLLTLALRSGHQQRSDVMASGGEAVAATS